VRVAICLSILAVTCGPGRWMAPSAAAEHVRDLRSDTAAVRVHAARRLGELADPAAVPALIEALGDKLPAVRRQAARSLGRLGDPRAASALIKALGDRDTNVRFYAAGALGRIKAPQAVEPLVRALRDPEWPVRTQAAGALREMKDPRIAALLAEALTARGADTAQITWILRGLRAGAVTKRILALLKAPDANVRARAVKALGTLTHRGDVDASCVDALIAALADESAAVRAAAVEVLVTVGDRRALAPIRKLAQREKDASVLKAARAAVERLSKRGDLVAHWSFDDRGTTTARDVTGRGNDGRILGCKPAKGKVGHALRFCKGSYIEFGRPAGLPIAARPFTIMAWAKSESPNGVVVARGGAFCGYSLYVKDGVATFGIHRTQDGPAHVAAGREKVVGAWVHLAGVVQGDRIELYVNGRLAATAKTPGLLPSDCGQGMEIGFDVGNSPAEITDNFAGLIDEVKMYGSALSADEIAEQCRSAGQK